MSYDGSQTLLIARALARHGRNVAKAREFLRTEYESFRRIGLNTLWRLLKNKKFAATVEAEYQLWIEADRRGVAAATEEAARRAQEGTIIAKIGRLESLFEVALKEVEEQLKDIKDDKITLDQKMRILDMVGKLIDRRKERLLPVLAESKEGAFLVEATFEAMYAKLGLAKTKELMSMIGPLYEEKRKAGEAKGTA